MTSQQTTEQSGQQSARPETRPAPAEFQALLADLSATTVPAGDYFLGDPCYAFANGPGHDEAWLEMLETSDYLEHGIAAIRSNDAIHPVWALGTLYGDGCYDDKDGGSYPVDSGMIGLVPAAAVHASERERLADLGRLVTFERPVTISEGANGLLCFGPFEILTGDEPPEPCMTCGRDTDLNGFCDWCGDPDDDDDDDDDDLDDEDED